MLSSSSSSSSSVTFVSSVMGVLAREKSGLQEQASLMFNEQSRKVGSATYVQSEPEPPLPYGWEKCLDLKSGVVYFKDWNTGMQIYRDPRRNSNLPFNQRIGHLSISLQTKSASEKDVSATATTVVFQDLDIKAKAANSSDDKKSSRRRFKVLSSGLRLPLELAIGRQSFEEDSSDRDSPSFDEHHEHSLKLSFNPPGANCSQEQSVCTVEKVQNALKWSQWGATRSVGVKRSHNSSGKCVSLTNSLSTSLALHSPPRPSSSRESNSPGPLSSPSTLSQCSSECLTSPSTMMHQGNEEDEVQQPRSFRESTTLEGCRSTDIAVAATEDAAVMVAVGCKSCLMYIMLPKLHPSCPKCGNADVLLDLPSPMPKKQRRGLELSSPKWNWFDARPIAT